MKKRLGQYTCVRLSYTLLTALKQQYGLNWLRAGRDLLQYIGDYRVYLQQQPNPHFTLGIRHFYPCLRDRTTYTPVEPTYFFQDTWAAGKLFQLRPTHHYDVGSSAMTVGILSQFVPTTMIDIRPLEVHLEGLEFLPGSILELPLADNSVASLSSLCVVEHIGLGRYGDCLDPWGSEKAMQELQRVLKPGGNLLVSVPVDQECRIYFNAHRAFTRDYALQLLPQMELLEEKYIYGNTLHPYYEPHKGFGIGLFHLRKSG